MSLITAVAGLRCDSRVSWSLALSTFAAWRGVAAAKVLGGIGAGSGLALRWNLIACGLFFCALGFWMRRYDRKRHFEPLTTFLGCLALLAGLGLFALDPQGPWIFWAFVFIVAAAGLALAAFSARRLGIFALGAVGVYAGVTRLAFEVIDAELLGCFWFAGSSLGMIALLWFVQRRFRAEVG